MLTFLAATWGWFLLAAPLLVVLAIITFALVAKSFVTKGVSGVGGFFGRMAIPYVMVLLAGVCFVLMVVGVIADFVGK